MDATVETITPDMAVRYLERNPNYRRLRNHRVADYAKAMREGRWKLTGEAIQFNSNGDLLNGQHRLSACVMARVPFTTVVVRGVGHDAVLHMDTGLNRSTSDTLRAEGIDAYTKTIGAVTRLVIAWRHDKTNDSRWMTHEITREQITAYAIDNYDALVTAIRFGDRTRRAIGGQSAILGAFYFEAVNIDAELAGIFAESLITGVGLDRGNPILALRSWVSATVARKINRPKTEWLTVLAKAWNAWVTDERVLLLKRAPNETPARLIDPAAL